MMTMPGFTAERALSTKHGVYRSRPVRGAAIDTYTIVPQAGVSGVYIGTTCYNGTSTEVYVDFGDDGYTVTGIHPVPVGSCTRAPASPSR